MRYKVKIKSYLECQGIKKEDLYTIEVALIGRDDEFIIVQNFPIEINNEMEKLNRVVSEVIYDKKDYSIKNSDDLIKKWKKEKKEIIFNEGGEEYVLPLMSISKYLEDPKTLSFFAKNYGVTPIILLMEKNKIINEPIIIREFELFNLFFMGKALFDIELNVDSYRGDKAFEMSGKLNEKYDIVKYKSEIKKRFNFQANDQLNLKVNLHGKYDYVSEKLKGALFNANVDIKEGYSMGYSVELEHLKGEIIG